MSDTVIGIDPSLSATAICPYTIGVVKQPPIHVLAADPPVKNVSDRICRWNDLVERIASEMDCHGQIRAIAIEGYSFGSRGGRMADLAEFGGLLRNEILTGFSVPLFEIPPTSVKKFATGKGNTGKIAVATALIKRYDVEYETDDEYDAYAIARMCACLVGLEKPQTKFQEEALKGLSC